MRGGLVISTIVAIIWVIILVVKWNNTATTKQINKEQYEFIDAVQLLDGELRDLKLYSEMGKDSIHWLDEHITPLKISIDSSIKFFKDNYRESEAARFDDYLKILKKYRDIAGIYDDWVTTIESNSKAEVKADMHEAYASHEEYLENASEDIRRLILDIDQTSY